MTQQNRSIMFLCLASGLLFACDEVDDSSAAWLPGDPAPLLAPELAVGMASPIAHGEAAQTVAHGPLAVQQFAAPEQAAIPVQGHGTRNISPKDEHLIGWVRWAMALPYYDGPISDQTGEDCAQGQDGPVWYLAGTFGGPVERECDIPAGKQLVFPLINQWCVFPPEYYPDQASIDADLPAIEAWYDDQHVHTCGLTLRIDGQDVMPDFETLTEETYIKVSEPFDIDLNEAHWAPEYFAGGVLPTTGHGNYVRLQPLPPGDHVIEFGGELCAPYSFSTSAKYVLHVGP
jgi:hypothetical protein